VALLLGGAGTYALWTTTGTVASTAAVGSGNLALTVSNGAWYWGNSACTTTTGAAITLANTKIVPGDCLIYKADVKVDAVGNHLKARATISATPTITYGSGVTASDITVATTTSFTTNGTTIVSPSANVYDFDATSATAAAFTTTGTAQVSVLFSGGSTVGKNLAPVVSVTDATISLTQTAIPTVP